MMKRLMGAAALLCAAGAANAGFTYFATSGSTLFRVNADTSVDTFDLGDSIIAQTVLDDGTILAFSDTKGSNGYEVYELSDPFGTPTLSLITDSRNKNAASFVDVNGSFFALTSGNLIEVDPVTFDLGASDNLGLSGEGTAIGGGAYDPASDTFYLLTRDDNVYTVDLDETDREATLLGSTGVDVFNMSLEFFGGELHAGIQTQDGPALLVGTVDTATGAFSQVTSIQLDGTGPTSISVLPTPGAAALAGFAGLFAARRRRA